MNPYLTELKGFYEIARLQIGSEKQMGKR